MARIPAYRITEAQWLTIIGAGTQAPNALYFVEINTWLVRVYETDNAGTPNPRVVASMRHRGAYNAGTDYLYGDVVEQDGSTWFCKVETSTGNAPPSLPTTSNTQWELLAKKGTDGVGSGGYGLPVGGVQYDLPVKQSGTDGDVAWNPVSEIPTIREKLTADLNLYVNGSTGSDSNDGLTSGTAFATLQKAANVAFGDYDLGGYNITINVAAGTYTAGVLVNYPQTGSGTIHFKGDETTPSNVLVSTGASVTFNATGNARFRVSGIKMQNTGYALVFAESGGIIDLKVRNEFGSTSGHRILTQFNGVIYSDGEEIISGTAPGGHYRASDGGIIYCQSAIWTASGTAAQGVFAWVANLGIVYAYANSSSGTFTGQRYLVTANAMINSNGGGASYFPGDAAGASGSGGIYG